MFRAAILVAIATTAVFAQSAWILLFDGKSLDGWTWSTAQTPPAPSWIVENGMLRTAPDHGSPTYLLSRDSYTDFELEFE